MAFWSMEDTILMENYGLLFTVFMCVNTAADMLPSPQQSKFGIV